MCAEEVCCPKFDPTGWDKKTVEWKDKKFIKGSVRTFFYMPINYGQVMTRLNSLVESADGVVPENLCLSDQTSKWKMNLLLATDREVVGGENVSLSGKLFCKVYEGSYSEIGEWMKDFESYTKENGLDIKKQYSWYTTCPKCAKKYGKNYVVLLGSL
jgi:hypothetical protein